MSGLSVFRLVGNVSVNGGYGVAEVAAFDLPRAIKNVIDIVNSV